MAKRKTVVRLPDGTVEARNSETKHYTHAVVCEVDNRRRADALRRDADEAQRIWDVAREIVQSGDLSRFERVYSYTAGSVKHYETRVPGFDKHDWLPDWKVSATWQEYSPDALRRMETKAGELRAKADKLAAGPQFTYAVWRWSERRDSADKAASGWQGKGRPGERFYVVECEES